MNIKKNFILSTFLTAVIAATGVLCGTSLKKMTQPAPKAAQKVETSTNLYGSLTIVGQDEGDDPAPADAAKVIINAPLTGAVGELIRLDVSNSTAESFRWVLVPDSVDFEVYDDGRHAVFSARKPGQYMFIVACAYKGTVDVVTHVINIGNAPVDPQVKYPVVEKPAEGAPLTTMIPYWCSQAKRPREETMKLAASFESIAATISAGVNTTPEAIIQATSDANRNALGDSLESWKPVLLELQTKFQKLAEEGKLTTAEQHAQTWREVAAGLRAYATLFDSL